MSQKKPPKDQYINLQDLKPGDKFYGWDGIINILIDCTADPLQPNVLSYSARRMKTNEIYQRTFHGAGIQHVKFLRYKGRDKNSFLAGFNSAMRICFDVLTPQQKQDLSCETHPELYHKSILAYEDWKENIKERP